MENKLSLVEKCALLECKCVELQETCNQLMDVMLEMTRCNNTENTNIKLDPDVFYKLYQKALEIDEKPDIYDYDVLIQWHGFYCNCGDGAPVTNTVIESIHEYIEECEGEFV